MRLKLISYDISNDRIRKKLSDRLIFWGFERIQYSVFLGTISSFQWDKCWLEIKVLEVGLEIEADRIFVLNISKNEWKKMQVVGFRPEDEEILNEKTSIWI
jgi:CRISPR-associated protein Cas2